MYSSVLRHFGEPSKVTSWKAQMVSSETLADAFLVYFLIGSVRDVLQRFIVCGVGSFASLISQPFSEHGH